MMVGTWSPRLFHKLMNLFVFWFALAPWGRSG